MKNIFILAFLALSFGARAQELRASFSDLIESGSYSHLKLKTESSKRSHCPSSIEVVSSDSEISISDLGQNLSLLQFSKEEARADRGIKVTLNSNYLTILKGKGDADKITIDNAREQVFITKINNPSYSQKSKSYDTLQEHRDHPGFTIAKKVVKKSDVVEDYLCIYLKD
jgi:hypothetical protein